MALVASPRPGVPVTRLQGGVPASNNVSLSPLGIRASTQGSPSDILGSFANYNAITGTPLPGSAAAATASPSAPSSTGGFDYQTLLANDPLLQQTLSGLGTSGAANQANLQAQQQRALIQYGGIPSSALSAPGLGAIDPTTQDLANQNTQAGLSTLAKLSNAYKQAQQGSDASLAARGLLRSGAYGQHAAENLLGYNQAQDTATQQLLDYLNGVYQGYLSQQNALSQQGYGATNDALTRLLGEISNGLITAPNNQPAAPPPPVPGPQPEITQQPVYYLPSRTGEPATVPAGTIPQPGRTYAV